MSKINSFFDCKKILFFISLAFQMPLSFSECILPTPDIGGDNVSLPNYSGYLKSASKNALLVKDYRGESQIYINVSRVNYAYSAFGGDEFFDKLKPGIAVRIWYKDCVFSKRPEAVYVEYFSNNNLDQPPPAYFNRGTSKNS